jgi:sorbitol-specific phosphotransferase system component IIA
MESKHQKAVFEVKAVAKHKESDKEVIILSSNVINDEKEVCYLYTSGTQLFVTPASKFIQQYELKPAIETE